MRNALLLSCTLLLLVLGLATSVPAAPQNEPEPDHPIRTMLLTNRSHNDFVAIRISDGTTTVFGRVDLGPGSEDEIENPGGVKEVRMDLGLYMGVWERLHLDGVTGLTLCPEHEGCLIVLDESGRSVHQRGKLTSLLPGDGSMPVCSLEGFRTGMTMRDACGLLKTYYTMEEDIYLASMGFANLAWSARLYANSDNATSLENAILESVELRQKLSPPNLRKVQASLDRQGYVPWQATFPGIELTFPEMTNYPDKAREELLELCIETFLRQGRGTASIIFAPEGLMQEIAAADFPRRDTQLYTVSMHRDSDTLVLDMTAYSVEDLQR